MNEGQNLPKVVHSKIYTLLFIGVVLVSIVIILFLPTFKSIVNELFNERDPKASESLFGKFLVNTDEEDIKESTATYEAVLDEEVLVSLTDEELYVIRTGVLIAEKYISNTLTDLDINEYRNTFFYDAGEVVSIDKNSNIAILKMFYALDNNQLGQESNTLLACDSNNLCYFKLGNYESKFMECINKEWSVNQNIGYSQVLLNCISKGNIIFILRDKNLSLGSTSLMKYLIYE